MGGGYEEGLETAGDEKNPGGVKRREAIFLFLLLSLGYFYSSVQRVCAGVVLPHMGETFGFSAALVGFLSSLFFYTYGSLQSVWGAVSDRIGPLRSCSVGLVVAGLGSALMLIAPTPFFIGLSRALCGLGLAALFTGIYLYAALAFPLEEYPFWVGCILVIGNMGTVAAVGPLGWLMDRLGYRGLYVLLALWPLAVASLLWLLRRSSPRVARRDEAAGKLAFRGICEDFALGFKLVFGYRPLWVIVFVWATLSAGILTLQGLWGVSWLAASSGATPAEARFWITFVSLGTVIGAPVGARVTSLSMGGRKGIGWTMVTLCVLWAIYIAGAAAHFRPSVMGALGFLVGFASGVAMVFCSSSVKSLVHLSRAGLAIGTGQTLLYLAVIVCQWGSGIIINCFPAGKSGLYLNDGFLVAFGLVALCIWLSFFSIFSVRAFRRADGE